MSDKTAVRFGIFPKILITMALIALLPLGAIWYVNYQSTTERITQHVEQQLERISEGLQGYIDTWVEMNLRMMRQNATLAAMNSMQDEEQNPVLEKITREYDWIYLAHTIGLNGWNVGRSDLKKPKYYGERVYFQQVLNGKPIGQQVLIGKTSGKPAFVLAVPFKDRLQKTSGVLAIATTITELSSRITNVKIGNTGRVFLVDEFGKVIAHQNTAYTTERKDLSDHPAVVEVLNRGKANVTYTGEDGKRRIASARTTKYGWILVAEQEYGEAFAPIQEANRNAMLLLAVTLVVVVLIAYLLSRRFSVPIQQLTAIAMDISRGKLDQEISHMDRGDEIGDLARSIDRLGVSVRLALQRIAKYRKEAAKAG